MYTSTSPTCVSFLLHFCISDIKKHPSPQKKNTELPTGWQVKKCSAPVAPNSHGFHWEAIHQRLAVPRNAVVRHWEAPKAGVNLPTPDQVNWSFRPVPLSTVGSVGSIFHHPIGRQKKNTYMPLIVLANWAIIYYRSHLFNWKKWVVLLMEEILHQLRLVVYPIIYKALYISNWCGISEPSTVGSIFHHPIGKDYKWHISGFFYCQLGDFMYYLPLIKGIRNSYW